MPISRETLYLAVGQLLVWAGIYYVFPALLLQWEASFGWSRADLTAAFMIAMFASAFAAPFNGRLIDAGYGPVMMAASAVIAGLCVAALSQVTTLTGFYSLWVIIGLCMAGCLYEPTFALITRARGVNARRAIIHVTLIAGFAGTLSFPAAHFLSDLLGWEQTVQIFGLVVVFIATPLLWLGSSDTERIARESPPDNFDSTQATDKLPNQQQLPASSRYHFIQSKVFWMLAVSFALLAVTHGATLHHLLPMLSERTIDPRIAVATVSSIGPMQVAGRLLIMSFEKRLSNHMIACICFVCIGLSVVVLVGTSYTPLLLLFFAPLFGGGYGIVSIIRPIIARQFLGGTAFGTKSGLLAFVYHSGSASSPWLGSLIWRAGGYDLLLLVLLALAVLGLLLYSMANRFSQD